MNALRRVAALVVLLASCHSRPRSLPSPGAVEYPRCLASDAYGNQVACNAPPRVYDGERCACGDGRGHVFYGRVQEYERP